jgi:3'(2'),5'-bisphosphate nucleotidase
MERSAAAKLDDLCALAVRAGLKTLEVYHSPFSVKQKADDSPVTAADTLSEDIILQGLAEHFAGVPVLAEESAAGGKLPELGVEFFLVDPLDGTREFINKTAEFTVNIALVRDGKPVLGVIHAPALGKLYSGAAGAGAWLEDVSEQGERGARRVIKTRPTPEGAGITAVASRSHRSPETDDFLKEIGADDFAPAGSSLKFCLIAEGKADIYPRFGRTMEWDTGAGQAILESAGGCVLTHPEKTSLTYGKGAAGFANPHFIAYGARSRQG